MVGVCALALLAGYVQKARSLEKSLIVLRQCGCQVKIYDSQPGKAAVSKHLVELRRVPRHAVRERWQRRISPLVNVTTPIRGIFLGCCVSANPTIKTLMVFLPIPAFLYCGSLPVVQSLFSCPLFIGYGIAGNHVISRIPHTSRACRITPFSLLPGTSRPYALGCDGLSVS
jgi:hypothetical protein